MKIINWISEKRLLDGYIGILGVVLFYRLLAKYHTTLIIFSLSMKAWRVQLFGVDVEYHAWNNTTSPHSYYPPYTVSVKLGKWAVVDNTREPARLTHESVERSMVEHRKKEAEEARLIQAAKEAGL